MYTHSLSLEKIEVVVEKGSHSPLYPGHPSVKIVVLTKPAMKYLGIKLILIPFSKFKTPQTRLKLKCLRFTG